MADANRLRVVERFWERVERTDGCWLWRGSTDAGGYGRAFIKETGETYAHRVSYVLERGPIPDGLQLDHLCRVRHCVNPDHLEPVTPLENTRRSPIAMAVLNARKTHCKWGHEFTPENTRIHGTQGYRVCRRCAADWQLAKTRAKKRGEA